MISISRRSRNQTDEPGSRAATIGESSDPRKETL